jgi:hypothetical protein
MHVSSAEKPAGSLVAPHWVRQPASPERLFALVQLAKHAQFAFAEQACSCEQHFSA